jgi:microcystin-dependent protein
MSDPFIAEIILFAGNFAPRGWAFCNGQTLPISQNTALFSLLGTTYGGDGRTTFALPDLRGRSPVHSGGNSAGPGLAVVRLGEKSGRADSVLPSHTHAATSQANAVGPAGDSSAALGNFWANDLGVSSATYHTGPATGQMNSGAITTTLAAAGTSPDDGNYHPYLGLNYIIALVGIFPSRN